MSLRLGRRQSLSTLDCLPSRSRVSDARGKTTPAAHSKRQRALGPFLFWYFYFYFFLARLFFYTFFFFLVQLFAWISIRIVIVGMCFPYKLIAFDSRDEPISLFYFRFFFPISSSLCLPSLPGWLRKLRLPDIRFCFLTPLSTSPFLSDSFFPLLLQKNSQLTSVISMVSYLSEIT